MNHLELVVQKALVQRVDVRTTATVSKSAQALIYARWRLHNGFALAVGDALALSLAILGGVGIRWWLTGETVVPSWGLCVIPLWWIGALFGKVLPSWGLGPVEELRRTTLLLLIVFGTTAAALFLGGSAENSGRLNMVATLAISTIVLPLVRTHVRGILCSGGEWGVPSVIYGAGPEGQQIIKILQREKGLGYNPIAVLDDNPMYWGRSVEGVQVVGHADYVTPYAPVAILAMPHLSRQRQLELLEGPLSHYRKVLIIPDLEAPSPWLRPRDLNGLPGFEISSNLTSRLAQGLKRLTDLLLVSLSTPLWMPLWGVVAAAIYCEDRQSPYDRRTRIGKDGRRFRTWNFRTMVPNPEAVLRRKLEEDGALFQEWETTYKLQDDPRITKVGRILRRTSLEGLPQLLNVLRGEMSLVGPRALPAHHHRGLSVRVRALREQVFPGIAGLGHGFGCSEIGQEQAEEHDSYYVQNWSLWLDVIVLARTLHRPFIWR